VDDVECGVVCVEGGGDAVEYGGVCVGVGAADRAGFRVCVEGMEMMLKGADTLSSTVGHALRPVKMIARAVDTVSRTMETIARLMEPNTPVMESGREDQLSTPAGCAWS
ncbi:MAG TPA: hypothetical protein VEU08_01155, partial [Vicinamibacterales bacterium]|nr:hypothetical protein [Vicinamibacterales bacterium]